MSSIFATAIDDILAALGEDVVLRGEVVSPSRRARITQGVEVYDREGNVKYAEYVGMFAKKDEPAKGNTLTTADASFVLDTIVQDNGHAVRYVLRKT